MKRIHFSGLLIVFFLFLCSPFAGAVIEQDKMDIYAVTSSNEALKAELIINIQPGTGKIWSSVGPLVGTSTQHTEKISVDLAKNYFDQVDQYDYLFDINSTASVVEGPSAGAAMSLLLISMLQDKDLPHYVSITGHISEGGSIGAVGGVFEKAEKASETGIKLFMVPEGEAFQMHRFPDGVKTVNLKSYAFQEWGMKVVEVKNISEALEFAFRNPEEIDINVEKKEETKMFVPEEIQITSQLKPMQKITNQYIKKAETTLESARKALNESTIDEPMIVSALLDSLTQSQRTLEKARLLQEKNYLYSSANYAFITIVESNLVKDLSENPSLIEPNSSLLEMRASDLKEEIAELEEDLNKFYSREGLEWLIAAKERLTWAKLKVKNLTQTKTIVISSTGSPVSNISIAIQNLRDYEYAKEWHTISKDFFEIAEKSQDKIVPVRILEQKAKQYIVEAENELALVSTGDTPDIERRLNAAKLAKSMGWNDSALFDAASALAFARAGREMQGKSLGEIMSVLERKLSRLEKEFSSSSEKFVWAKLYFDHASYFFDSAQYFNEQQNISRALEDAKSALRLAFFCEEMLTATKQAQSALKNIHTTVPYKEGIREKYIEPVLEDKPWLPLIAFITVIGGVTVVLVGRTAFGSTKSSEESFISKKMNRLEWLKHQTHRARLGNKLDEKEYSEKSAEFESQLRELEEEKKRRSKHLIEIDKLHAELEKIRHLLKELKEQYREGEIIESDYKEMVQSLTQRLSDLQNQVSFEEKSYSKKKKFKKTKNKTTKTKKKKTKSKEKKGKKSSNKSKK